MSLLRSRLLRANSGVGLSRSLWENIDYERIMLDPNYGFFYFNHFNSLPASGYTLTDNTPAQGDGPATVAVSALEAGVLTLDSASATVANGGNLQFDGCRVELAAGKKVLVETRIRLVDIATGSEFFFGLHAPDTSIITNSAMNDGQTDAYAGFVSVTDNNVVVFYTADGETGRTAGTTTMHTFTEGGYVKLGFYVNGVTSITPYVNGVAATAVTTKLPDDVLVPSYVCQVGTTNEDVIHQIDWLGVAKVY